MMDNEKAEFVEALNGVFELYGRAAMSATGLKMYFGALERFSVADVKKALNRHVQNPDNGQFFPKPADIIREIDGSAETQAGTAWSKVDSAVRRIGHNRSVVFDDPIIHQVITDMGGWIMLAQSSSKDYPFKAIEFSKRYRGYASRPQKQVIRKLVGFEDDYNDRHGFKVAGPILIGNKALAMKVLESGLEGREKLFHSVEDVVENLKLSS